MIGPVAIAAQFAAVITAVVFIAAPILVLTKCPKYVLDWAHQIVQPELSILLQPLVSFYLIL